jgi:dolichol kinase
MLVLADFFSTPRLLDYDSLMDPLIAVLTLILMTATITTLFAVVRRKGEGAGQAIAGIALGWVLFLSPLYFFGPTGAVLGIVVIMLVGGLISVIGQRYDRGPARR